MPSETTTIASPARPDDYRGRHSEADIPALVSDPVEVARLEARNALRQYDVMVELAEQGISRRLSGQRYRLRPSAVLALHRACVDGIDAYAGAYRPGDVRILRSHHAPPPADAVAELVEDLCDWVNDHIDTRPPTELAAYVLWQLCWIHPFTDGNGRTARAVSYLVMLIAYGMILPGTPTIPEQISEDRRPYYTALEAADRAMESGAGDVSEMTALMERLLERQLGVS